MNTHENNAKDSGGSAVPNLTPEMEKIVAAAVAAALASQKAAEAKPEQKVEKETPKADAVSELKEAASELSVAPPPPPCGVPGKWGIKTAFKSCLQRYTKFDGRASRPEFWYLALGNFIVVMSISLLSVVATAVCFYAETAILLPQLVCNILVMVYGLFMLLPGLSLCVRRLHDTGRDWRLLLLGLIPGVGALILLYFFIQPSAPANKYGSESDGLAGEDEKMPPFVATIAGKAAALLRRPGRTAAILGGGIAALVGVIVLINFVFARPNPLEALYEQGKLAKSPRDASNMYEGLFCKQVEAYLDGDAELNALPYVANLLTVADSKGFMVPVEVVSGLVELGADVNAKSKIGAFGETPWNLAVKMGDIAMLDYLASAGAKKTEFLEMEQPHVVQAVLEEKEELLRALVRHGMSLEVQKSATDYTALMAAADKGNTKMLSLLIELGANVNATRAELGGEKVTVLDMVLQEGRSNDAEMVGILIKAGAKATPNKLADKLFRCIDEGQTERLKMLLDAGAPLDAVQEFTAYTPLMAAVDKNSPEMVKLLLDAGADPKVTTKDDAGIEQSALSTAKRKASSAVLALLGDEQAIKMQKALGDTKLISLDEAVEMLQKCEIIDQFGKIEQNLLGEYENVKGDISKKFMYNYELCKDGHKTIQDFGFVVDIYKLWGCDKTKHLPQEALKAFIAAGSSLSWYYNENWYALDYACHYGHHDVIELLLAAGADLRNGLHILRAIEANKKDTVEFMLKNGVDINAVYKYSLLSWHWKDSTALMAAVGYENMEMVKFLIEKGADVNAVNSEGDTALTSAVMKRNMEMLKYLVEKGANVNQVNKKGDTVLLSIFTKSSFGRDMLWYVDVFRSLLTTYGASQDIVNNEGFTLRKVLTEKHSGWVGEAYLKILNEVAPQQVQTAGSDASAESEADPQEAASEKIGSQVSAEALKELEPLYNRLARLKCKEAYSALCQKRLLMLLSCIRNGDDVNCTRPETKGSNALHYACSLGSLSITKWLLKNGADPNAKTAKGADPITCVGSDNRAVIIKVLKEYGARKE